MAGFNFLNNNSPVVPVSTTPIKKVDVSKNATPTVKPYDFSAPSYFPQSFKFKKGNWNAVYTEPTKPVVGSPQYNWNNRVVVNPKAYEPTAAKKSAPAAEVPVYEATKSATNPFEAVAYSVAASAVDTVGKAADFILGGYIRSVGDVKAGIQTAAQTLGVGKITDPYLLNATSGIYSDKSAADKAKKGYDTAMLRNFDALTGQYSGLENIPILTDEKKAIKGFTDSVVKTLNKKADLENQGEKTNFAANVVNSLPYTAVSRLPFGVGAFLNYGTSTMQAIEQKVAESGNDINSLTLAQKVDIMNYATGSALVNAGSEQIFPAGKGAGTVVKAVAKTAFKDTVKATVKFLIKNGVQEATEETVSYIGNGLVAAITTDPVTTIFADGKTDPRKTLLGLGSGSALINLVDLGTTIDTAFVSGFLFSGIGMGTQKAKTTYSNFKNTKAAYEAVKDVPLDQITEEQVQNSFDAIAADVAIPENKRVVLDQAKIAIAQTEANMPINQQIEQYQNVLQEVYSDDTSAMTPEQATAHKEYVSALQEKIAELDSQQTVITSNGKKFSIDQLQEHIQKQEARVAELRENFPINVSPARAIDHKIELNDAIESLDRNKKLLQQATQPLTSAEMLANMQASRMPVKAPSSANGKVVAGTAAAPQMVTSEVESAPSALPLTKIGKMSGKFVILVRTDNVMGMKYDYEPGYKGVRLFNTKAEAQAEADKYVDKNVAVATSVPSDAISNAPSGDTVESIVSPGVDQTSTIKIINPASVIASTDADGNVNPNYDKDLQPRNVDRAATKALIASIAFKKAFRSLIGIETLQEGSPVIGDNGMVVTGNHRIAGILRMMRDNRAAYEEYKEFIRSNAKKFGLNVADIQGDFIMVRVLPAGTDLKSLVDVGNARGTAAMSTSEIAINDSKNLSNAVMAKFVADSNGEMTGAESKAFNNRFINEVVPEAERGSLRDADGNISMDGLRRIQNAMFFKAYGNLDLLTRVSESTNNNVKKLTNTLINISPRIVTLKEGISGGQYYDLPTAQLITDVAQKWVSMKQSKDGKDILAYIKGDTKQKQTDMFNEKEDPLEMSMILAIETNRGSAKNLTSLFNDIIGLHMAEGAPTTGFFGVDKNVNINTIVQTALEGGKYGTVQDLESLYAASGDGTDETEATVGSPENGSKTETILIPTAKEIAREGTGRAEKAVEVKNNIGYHAGDLGKAEFLGSQKGSERGTGHFGTGTYFVGNKKEIELGGYKDRPLHSVDFSEYNLYTPKTPSVAMKVHESLKYLNRFSRIYTGKKTHSSEDIETLYSGANKKEIISVLKRLDPEYAEVDFEQATGYTFDEYLKGAHGAPINIYVEGMSRNLSEENAQHQKDREKQLVAISDLALVFNKDKKDVTSWLNEAYSKVANSDRKTDSVSTLFMKSLGYEGVDVRHIPNMDNTMYGSVIYDLHKKTAEAKPAVPKPTLAEAQKAYAETVKREVPKTAFEKQVDEAAKKYKSVDEIDQVISDMQAESLQLDFLPVEEKKKKIIQMNLQLFALKKALLNFGDVPTGDRRHSFIDSFTKMLQVGSTKDMSKFITDYAPVEEITYKQLANKNEIAISDAEIAKGGVAYQEDLLQKFLSNPDKMLAPNETVSMSRYLVNLTKASDADTVAKGMNGLYALKDRLTQAGQFTQSVRAALDALIPDRQAKALANDLDNRASDPIDKTDIKKQVDNTKKIAGEAVQKSLDDTVGEFEKSIDKSDSDAVDESVPKSKNGEKASMEQLLAALIKKDIVGVKKKTSDADGLALQVLHKVYLELNPSEKGKSVNIFDSLSTMAINKDKYGDVWDKAKPLVEAAIAKENLKREAAGLGELVVPENYLDRFRDPDFTKRMMNQAIRQVLNYNRTDMKSEARKFYLEGGTGENTINRFVSGLRDKFDDAYGQAMPEETFNYLKEHLVAQFKESLKASKDSIKAQVSKQVNTSADKNIIGRKSRIDKTIDQLTDSVISGALSDDNLSKIWANKLGLNYISDEMRATISKRIVEIDAIENEDERFHAYSDFVSELGGQIKANNIQKFNAWRRFAMLCNPKTWTRNGASNYAYLPYTKVMDGMTYRIQKSLGLEQEYMARGQRYLKAGMNKGIDLAVDTYLTPAKIRTIMEENGKYSLGEHLKREVKIFENAKLEAITKAPLNIISTGTLTKDGKNGIPFFGDQGILKTHLTSAFRNKLNALGYNESLSDTAKKSMEDVALKYAKEVALSRTYRAASVISERLTNLKVNVNNDTQIKNLTKSGTAEDLAKARKRRKELNATNAAIDLAIPFIVTPAAIATEGYRLSPIALGVSVGELIGMKIKHETKENPYRTAQVSKQISQALVGVGGQWVLGAVLALTGAITGAPPDTDKEKKEWVLEGKTAYSLYVPGIGWISYSWCQPVALGIMGGADIGTVIRNGGYNISAIPGALVAGLNGVVGATLYGNIVDNLFGGRTVAENMNNFLTSSLTQTFPTITKALATSIDPYTRDTYSGTTAQAMLYRVLSYVPFASMLQPVKIDIWGNPVKNADLRMGILGRGVLNFLSPFTKPEAQTDVVSKEVIRLFNATNSNSALPVTVTASWTKTIDKQKYSYELSGQDYVDFQTLMGQRSFKYAELLINNKLKYNGTPIDYKKASDEDKVKWLTKIYSIASDEAKTEYIRDHAQQGINNSK
jgi:hypothetical protein